ncbi:UDP-galactopyranose mutase [Paracoccus sediminis]|uniref:UDP-galactopyranose mutase n=2 Tax=Paracoccus sediminis TaxID=1214787 RepID=A0A238WQD5_9RHOB|nr:UDP-galactopyranose mutase [Paracoccus sediminis]SNR47879.1 UDP-galactopyranose mutase [Paracoccus sediminis]
MTNANPLIPLVPPARPALICFSHLRWDFVLQRPQHLMSRFADHYRLFFWEEAIPTDHHLPYLEFHAFDGTTVQSIRPRVPAGWPPEDQARALSDLLDQMMGLTGIHRPVLWFYTPMMWPIAAHVDAAAVVYDCMDELSAFRFAPPGLAANEAALMAAADVVFTGGHSIFEAKAGRHRNIHPFPSSVDTTHFARARGTVAEPADQAVLPRPRMGYYGVIDERLDLGLIAAVAKAHPDWSVVMIGPLAKISPDDLPRAPNIHWLGQRTYDRLPDYLAGWDVALMPFAMNDATRFISPTKTPEYLAGGVQVVSTPVRDVVRHYGGLSAVHIANDAPAFVRACESALARSRQPAAWRDAADRLLSDLSWDNTFQRMRACLNRVSGTRLAIGPAVNVPAPPTLRGARKHDVTICGAGFAGSVLARQFAEESGKRVLLVDRRDHIAGNAFDSPDEAGIRVHRYGPHVFHTDSDEVFAWLGRFTEWRPYEHRVMARVGDMTVPMPINRTTLNAVHGLDMRTEAEARTFLARIAPPVPEIRTARDAMVKAVGTDLYERFLQGSSRKRWGLDPSLLDPSAASGVTARTDADDRRFTDRHQAMPRDGYTRMFERMLDHPGIEVALGTDFHDLGAADTGRLTVYTGPIDAYFGHRFGALPYRSLRFRHETLDRPQFQQAGVVAFPAEDVPWSRIVEHKHLTGQIHARTTITHEYPADDGDPFYPVPTPENLALFRRYDALAAAEPDVIFAGRLAGYRWCSMDRVVAQALALHGRLDQRLAAPGAMAPLA